ncbi:MAG: magnesium transporter [Oscillospiraceae bacterium]|nr:magnesium transporter [Oscillospiraceae bacterium]
MQNRKFVGFGAKSDEQIGSRASENFISVYSDADVRAAMKQLIAQAADKDNIATIFVVNKQGRLIGAIALPDLIIARENTRLESIISPSHPFVYADEIIEDCIERLKDCGEDLIAVVNREGKLEGVLTSQDITQLVDDELAEDYARLAGLTEQEDLLEPLKKSLSKRLPWLAVLLLLGMIVSAVVGAFERVVENLTMIVNFQSLVLAMAGNVGTQSLAVTIRVLVDEELGGKQKLFLVLKEMRLGLCNGVILGVLSFVLIGVYLSIFKGESRGLSFSVSLCTGTAMALSMLLSSISGTTVPLLFKKLKIDPAVASGPLITTINDLVAVVSYYGLAALLLLSM